MNDDLMTSLDDRGRAAGAAARAAVAEHAIPDFDPDLVRVSLDDDPSGTSAASLGSGDRRGRRWVAVLGVAAALLVVALGAALVSRTGDDDSAPADNVDTSSVRPFVAGWLPEGLSASMVSDGWDGPTSGSPLRLTVVGPDEADHRIGLVVTESGTSIAEQVDEDPQLYRSIGSAGGREVFARDDDIVSYAFDEGDRQVVLFTAPDVDQETVLAVAGAAEVDGTQVSVGDLPEGWAALGVVEDPFFSTRLSVGLGPDDHFVTYSERGAESSDETTASTMAIVMATPGSSLDVGVARLFSHRNQAEDVVVRGHPAVLARTESGEEDPSIPEEWVVAWEERPGEVVRVVGLGLSRDDVLAVAEDVRPASGSEWEDLARTAVLTPGPGEELIGSGEFSDGSPWALVVRDDGESEPWANLRMSVPGGDDAVSSSGIGTAISEDGEIIEPGEEGPPVLPGITVSRGSSFGWAYGLLDATSGAGVARIVVEDASGAVVADAVIVGADDLRGWVVELPAGLVPFDDSSASGSDEGSSSGSSSESPTTTFGSAGVATTAGSGDVDGTGDDGPMVVAYAADGSELARQPLP